MLLSLRPPVPRKLKSLEQIAAEQAEAVRVTAEQAAARAIRLQSMPLQLHKPAKKHRINY